MLVSTKWQYFVFLCSRKARPYLHRRRFCTAGGVLYLPCNINISVCAKKVNILRTREICLFPAYSGLLACLPGLGNDFIWGGPKKPVFHCSANCKTEKKDPPCGEPLPSSIIPSCPSSRQCPESSPSGQACPATRPESHRPRSTALR